MLIQFAITLTVLIAFCGLAIDVGLLALKKVQLQNAADAAATGAVYQVNNSQAALTAAGITDAQLNGFTDGSNNVAVTLDHPPANGPYAGNSQAVTATVSQNVQPFFFPNSIAVSAQATALAPPYACAYFLSQATTQDSLHMINEKFASQVANCNIYVGKSFYLQSGSTSTGYQYLVASTTNGNTTSAGVVSPAPIFGVPTTADPLIAVPPPVVGGCPTPAPKSSYSGSDYPTNSAPIHIPAGVYCGGLTIQNFKYVQVVLDPGVYVIAGTLYIGGTSGGTRISGSGVTFYMTQLPGYNYGQATFEDALTALVAPTSGSLQGILYFSDRNLPAGQSTLSVSASGPNSTLDGILYLWNQQLHASAAFLAGNQYFGVVADNLLINNSDIYFSSNYSSLAAGNPFQPTGGGLVQ